MDRLEGRLERFGIMPGLGRTRKLCEALGDPQDSMEIILVTGTNGKGSVAAALSSMLTASGRRTGAFFSPHIHRHNERFRVDGAEISDDEFRRYEDLLLELNGQGYEMTVFEALAAIAFLHFHERGCTHAVMEIGMGGRLDATNVAQERLAIITNAALEHTEYLGRTVREIAADKSCIIKNPRGAAVTGCGGEALEEVRKRCAIVGARLREVSAGRDFALKSASPDGTVFDFFGRSELRGLFVPLAGRHQAMNCSLAAAAAEELGLGEDAIRVGLANTRHPGRLEIVGREPLVVADGAHNPEGIRTLVESLGIYPRRKLVCVFSALETKDWRAMIAVLAPNCDEMIVNQMPHHKAARAEEMAAEASKLTCSRAVPDIAESVLLARESAGSGGMVLICGSLYMLGAAIEAARGNQ